VLMYRIDEIAADSTMARWLITYEESDPRTQSSSAVSSALWTRKSSSPRLP